MLAVFFRSFRSFVPQYSNSAPYSTVAAEKKTVSPTAPGAWVSMLLMNVGAFSICSANAIWERPRRLLISPIRLPNASVLNAINNTSLKKSEVL